MRSLHSREELAGWDPPELGERGRDHAPSGLPRKPTVLMSCSETSGPQDHERMHVCGFEPLDCVGLCDSPGQ